MLSRRSPSKPAALFRAAPVPMWAGVAGVVLLIGFELLAIAAVLKDGDETPIALMARNVPAPEPASVAIMPQSQLVPEPPSAAPQSADPVELVPAVPQPQTEPDRAADEDRIHYFGGRPIRHVRTIRMLVTAYSPDERSCGKFADNITASGYSVWTNGMKLVAADTDLLPFGTVVTVPGYNGDRPVPVLDRGGKIKGSRLDVLYPTHEIARGWGAQRLDVDVWEYAD